MTRKNVFHGMELRWIGTGIEELDEPNSHLAAFSTSSYSSLQHSLIIPASCRGAKLRIAEANLTLRGAWTRSPGKGQRRSRLRRGRWQWFQNLFWLVGSRKSRRSLSFGVWRKMLQTCSEHAGFECCPCTVYIPELQYTQVSAFYGDLRFPCIPQETSAAFSQAPELSSLALLSASKTRGSPVPFGGPQLHVGFMVWGFSVLRSS